MPSPENEPDRYSMKWEFAPKPPNLISAKDLEKGERYTMRQNPIWSMAPRLEYEKKMAAARSPGPIYDYDLNHFKSRGASWQQYRGERSWFNKPKKGNGEASVGLGPSQISTVEQKHPLIKREQTATLNNFNPRLDDKTLENMSPGQDPGRYPPDAKDAVTNRPPSWVLGIRSKYVVGTTQSPADVPLRDCGKMLSKGGLIDRPGFTIGKRLPTLTRDQINFPSPAQYGDKSHKFDGSARNAPSSSFGTSRRFPRPRFG